MSKNVAGRAEAFQRAVEEIMIWKSRTDRLAAGVETTLCLLLGALAHANIAVQQDVTGDAHVCLTLATAVNRFLNLISHTGFNLLGLTKYYDVAERFGIPDWIVEVRHETTHGHMPSKELLLDALAFCLKWINQNYWIPELKKLSQSGSDEDQTTDIEDEEGSIRKGLMYENLHRLFYFYRYL